MKKLIFALLALCFLFFVATNGQNSCYSGSSTSNNAPNSTTPLTTGNVCATYDLTCQINSSQCTQQQQLQGTCIHVYSAISQSNCNSLIDSPDVYNVVCCDTNLCNVPSGENPTCQYQYCYSGVMTSNLAPQGQLLLGSGQSCVRYDFVCNSNYNSSCTAQEQQSGVCKVYYGVVETELGVFLEFENGYQIEKTKKKVFCLFLRQSGRTFTRLFNQPQGLSQQQ